MTDTKNKTLDDKLFEISWAIRTSIRSRLDASMISILENPERTLEQLDEARLAVTEYISLLDQQMLEEDDA